MYFDIEAVADMIINYHKIDVLSIDTSSSKASIADIAYQVKEILIDLEADKGCWLTPSYFIKVPMDEIGFKFIYEVSTIIFNTISEYLSNVENNQPLFI
jgi:hypothetical protein